MPVRRVRRQNYYGSPCQSDVAILMTVEDLINLSMGPATENKVNFKMLQAILHIFARQLRMMEQHVEIQIAEEPPSRPKSRPTSYKYSKRDHRPRSSWGEFKERPQRFESKDRGKSPTISSSGDEKKKTRRAKSKERGESSSIASSDSKDRVEKYYQKQKAEMENDKLANMNEEERDQYFKDREKAMLAKMDENDRVKYIKEEDEETRERRKRIITNMGEKEKAVFAELDKKEREMYLLKKERKEKEKAKLEKYRKIEQELQKKKDKSTKETERDEKPKKPVRDETDESDERERSILAKMGKKEKAEFAKLDGKIKEKYLKDKGEESEKAMIANMDENVKEKFARMDKKGRAKYLGEKEKKEREKEPDRDRENKDILAKMEDTEMKRFAKLDENGKDKYLKQKREELSKKLPKMDDKDMEKIEKLDLKGKGIETAEEIEKEMFARMDSTEKKKFEKMDKKGKEKFLKEKEMNREKAILAKMDKKEKEKYAKMDKNDKEKYISGKERESRGKEGKKEKAEFAHMDEKGKEQHLKEKEKEQKENAILAKMTNKEQEKFSKMDKMGKEKYLSEKEREKKGSFTLLGKTDERKEELIAKMNEKDKAEFAQMDEKGKEQHVKQKEKEQREKSLLAKMNKRDQEKFAKMDRKGKDKYLDTKEKEEREKTILTKMDAKEKAKFAKMNEKGKEKYLKQIEMEKAILENMDEEEKTQFLKKNETDREKYLKEIDIRGKKKEKDERKGQEKEEDEESEEFLTKFDENEYQKLHDKEEAKLAGMNKKEKYLKEKEKSMLAKIHDEEDANLAEMNEKENEKYLKEGGREKREKSALAKMHDMEEAAELTEMTEKETEKYLKEKEREQREKSMLAKMTKKEQEKFAKMDGRSKEKYLDKKEREAREKTILAKMDEKERAKFAKMDEKEKEKYLNQMEIEKAIIENMTEKEKKHFSKMDEKGKENYLIEKASTENEKEVKDKAGFAKGEWGTRVGSIEVVTVSQFELLKADVEELQEKATPIPFPTMPDNEKLRQDIASGSASLSDTMQAMQVSARLQAAETAISQMAGILTALAASGDIPMDVAQQIEGFMGDPGNESPELKTYGAGTSTTAWKGKDVKQGGGWRDSFVETDGPPPIISRAAASWSARPSALPVTTKHIQKGPEFICRAEFDNALRHIRDKMTANANTIATKTLKIVNAANNTATNAADKLVQLFELNKRVDDLYGLVGDYVNQFAGFDAGVNSQMGSFNEQMRQMRQEMQEGITQLLAATVTSETEAVQELYSRFEDLVIGLDVTVHSHNELNTYQSQLGDELSSVLACVETLRDEKVDRDEVLDCMQDKADITRLTGLVSEKDFNVVHERLELQLAESYDKFIKQDDAWMKALKDLSSNLENKSDLIQVGSLKKETEEELKKIQQDLILLAKALGDPKAALLTRQLSVGALCGPCRVPALQETTDPSASQPPLLPPLRCLRPVELNSCEPLQIKIPQSTPVEMPHMCHRWVGGSHTLLSESVVRRQAAPLLQPCGSPAKKYSGVGVDGKMYRMEGTLDPCMPCNTVNSPPIDLRMDATGDSVKKSIVLLNNNIDLQ